ncbi:hypothetical protein [Aminobacter sp. HY435]|uniref:hypothetical protein n=1 Tax=Aminobacter sp. HY435 TaxID=2970917 RepID=UPI0022B9BAB0|nr:hypothetical protein [Aminobacter sp. HY435]
MTTVDEPEAHQTNDAAARRNALPLRDTLLTVLLVLYPALGAVGVIAAGLMFANAGV